jgi:hypothetical protein
MRGVGYANLSGLSFGLLSRPSLDVSGFGSHGESAEDLRRGGSVCRLNLRQPVIYISIKDNFITHKHTMIISCDDAWRLLDVGKRSIFDISSRSTLYKSGHGPSSSKIFQFGAKTFTLLLYFLNVNSIQGHAGRDNPKCNWNSSRRPLRSESRAPCTSSSLLPNPTQPHMSRQYLTYSRLCTQV